ncbi:MAG: hypothetical protein ABL931_05405 [Usitatibacteraceae bacterium]
MNIIYRVAVIVFLATIASFAYVEDASAYPASAWRTRNTGLDSEGRCIRRATGALKNAGLSPAASSANGVSGRNDLSIVYVICTNQGSFATVFCASDRDSSGQRTVQICDAVSRFMER